MTFKLIIIIVSLILYAVAITKKSIELKSELKLKNKDKKTDERTKEKIKTITTGNIDNDFIHGIDILHDLSKK